MVSRVAIVSANQQMAEGLRNNLADRGFSAALFPPAAASQAFQTERGKLLLIIDPSDGAVDSAALNAQAQAAGAQTLLLSKLNGAEHYENLLSSGADFSWPAAAVDSLAEALPALLREGQNASTHTGTLFKSMYFAASAMARQAKATAPQVGSGEDTGAQLVEARAEIARLRKEMDSFTYSVSHDLRAPLRAIEGFTRIMTEDFAGQLDAEGQKFLSYVVANSQHMGRLIDDLLVYHRIGKAPFTPADLDMTELAKEAAAEQRALDKRGEGQRATVAVSDLLPARADRTLIQQAFSQYISNALKFSRGANPPQIDVGSRAEGDEHVYFVKDNGIGFDMQYGAKLFQVFQKLQRQDEYEGNGIGLAIVQRILQRHGGRVWAEAAPDEGATFYFSLPAKESGQKKAS